jgi:hypothetical protein
VRLQILVREKIQLNQPILSYQFKPNKATTKHKPDKTHEKMVYLVLPDFMDKPVQSAGRRWLPREPAGKYSFNNDPFIDHT